MDPDVTTIFNKIYDETYKKTLGYVIRKCNNTDEISDILQETYVEVYSVLIKKGQGYINNTEAFVLKVAKSKVYKHYSLIEKLKNVIDIFSNSDNEQIEYINDFVLIDDFLVDKIENKKLIEEIASFISLKPQLTQQVFYLFYYNELTISQIAKELYISESNVKNRLYRTVKEIRNLYGKDGTQNE